jgi:hypothetical protein
VAHWQVASSQQEQQPVLPPFTMPGLVAIKLVSSTGESGSSILIFALAPVTLLTALSKSSLGKKVR